MWSAVFLCVVGQGGSALQSASAPDIAAFSSGSASTSGTLKRPLSSNHSAPVPWPWHINCYHRFTKSRRGRVSGLGLNGKTTESRSEDTDGQPEEEKAGWWETLWLLVNSDLSMNSLRVAGMWPPMLDVLLSCSPTLTREGLSICMGLLASVVCVVVQLKHGHYLPLF